MLRNFPISPSDNKRLIPVKRGKMVLSQSIRDYKTEVEAWSWQNARDLKALKPLLMADCPLQIDLVMKMPRHHFYTQKGQIKKIDAPNFQKTTLDVLSKLLGIDDSRFFSFSIIKACDVVYGIDIFLQAMPHQ